MPYVEETIQVTAPVETVWLIVSDMEAFGDFMPNIERVSVLAQGGGRQPLTAEWEAAIAAALALHQLPAETPWTVTKWVGYHKEAPMIWTEVDLFCQEARTIYYHLIRGQIGKMEGAWKLTEIGGVTDILLSVEIAFKGEVLQRLVGPQLEIDTRANCQSLLRGVKMRAEAQHQAAAAP